MESAITPAVDDFAKRFLSGIVGQETSLDRFVDAPSGLSVPEMLSALGHPSLGRLGIQMMADFMHPTNSRYFDAIYGSFFGQKDIRNWLVPTMAQIEFIDFVPTQPPAFLDDGEGVTSVDEWQMFANLAAIGAGEGTVPMSKGVSVRRYRDGWITWACDVYDTSSFRTPPPDGSEAAPIPDSPSPPSGITTRPLRSPCARRWTSKPIAANSIPPTRCTSIRSSESSAVARRSRPGSWTSCRASATSSSFRSDPN